MDIIIRSEDCTEVWDGVLYKKLSDYPPHYPLGAAYPCGVCGL